jgi:hypothetical protein
VSALSLRPFVLLRHVRVGGKRVIMARRDSGVTPGRRVSLVQPEHCTSKTKSTEHELTQFHRQAKALQASLLEIVDRVEIVRSEHEKLEGGNRFLQS